MEETADEPLTPGGRMFVRPEFDQIIHCALGLEGAIDVRAAKEEISKSLISQHPRFSSLLVRDRHGRERWRRIQLDIDRHIIVHEGPVGHSSSDHSGASQDGLTTDEDAVNDYIADLSVSSPLSTDKPLWEIHILRAHACAVFRMHHSLGDGVSLMSMFSSCCRRADDPSQMPSTHIILSKRPKQQQQGGLRKLAMAAWLTALYVMEFGLRSLYLKDRRTILSGGEGVELWPRKIATAKFMLEDMKLVKGAIAGSTINDVLMAVISSGLSKYLKLRSPKAAPPPEGLRITGLAFVNLRKQPGQLVNSQEEVSQLLMMKGSSSWGNKIGIVLMPFHYRSSSSSGTTLESVRWAKAMVDKKKLSLEAWFSHMMASAVMSCFGPKVATCLVKRVVNNTTFTISNVAGPQQELTFAGHKIKYVRVNTSSVSHAITMHMVSYAGRADLQILAARDIIPDPKLLARCFQDSLQEMKQAAAAVQCDSFSKTQ